MVMEIVLLSMAIHITENGIMIKEKAIYAYLPTVLERNMKVNGLKKKKAKSTLSQDTALGNLLKLMDQSIKLIFKTKLGFKLKKFYAANLLGLTCVFSYNHRPFIIGCLI